MNFLIYELFPTIIDMSITASFVIVFVLITRFLLKKTPKIFTYALWGVVLFRLLCPITFESAIGLLPTDEQIVTFSPQTEPALVAIELPPIEVATSPIEYTENSDVGISVSTEVPIELVFMVIWIIGIIAMLSYSIRQYIKLKQKIIISIPLKDNIFIADNINSPFVIGLFRPKIYLPSSLPQNEYSFIIAHEMCHIKRFDHITRILAFIALTIHWFNPLVWVAFIMSSKDMEMSCDESVMKNMDTDIRAEYATSLLRIATGKGLITATPLAFGEGDPKTRVSNIMKYKKPFIWVSVSAIIVVALLTIGFMSRPLDDGFTDTVDPIPAMIIDINRENMTMIVEPLVDGSAISADIILDISGTTFMNGRLETSIENFSVGYTVNVYINSIDNNIGYPLLIEMDTTISSSSDLTIEDFENIDIGTHYDEIIDKFGTPITQYIETPLTTFYSVENYTIAIYFDENFLSTETKSIPFEEVDIDFENLDYPAGSSYENHIFDGYTLTIELSGDADLDNAVFDELRHEIFEQIPWLLIIKLDYTHLNGGSHNSYLRAGYLMDLQGFIGQALSPDLDPRSTLGTDVVLDYVDDEKIIFHGYFGLFIYNLREEKITLAIDLKSAVGAYDIQGMPFADVKVNSDKDTLMIYHNTVYGAHKDLDALYIDIKSEQYEFSPYVPFEQTAPYEDGTKLSGTMIGNLKFSEGEHEWYLFDSTNTGVMFYPIGQEDDNYIQFKLENVITGDEVVFAQRHEMYADKAVLHNVYDDYYTAVFKEGAGTEFLDTNVRLFDKDLNEIEVAEPVPFVTEALIYQDNGKSYININGNITEFEEQIPSGEIYFGNIVDFEIVDGKITCTLIGLHGSSTASSYLGEITLTYDEFRGGILSVGQISDFVLYE